MCGFDVQDKPEAEVRERIYTEGCLIRINQWVQSNLYWVGGIALGVAFVQLLGIQGSVLINGTNQNRMKNRMN